MELIPAYRHPHKQEHALVIYVYNTKRSNTCAYTGPMVFRERQGCRSDGKVHWFTSVRDTIAFTLLPEEPKNIAVIYVNDMSQANWDNRGEDNWIDDRSAWYVVNSKRMGGMGAQEAVPFSTQNNARQFAQEHGGTVVDFKNIPRDYIFESTD